MTIEDTIADWATDSKIDPVTAGRESLRLASIHSKWLRRLTLERMDLRKREVAHDLLKAKLGEYYRGELGFDGCEALGRPPWQKRMLKNEIGDVVGVDQEVVVDRLKIIEQAELVSMLEEIMKAIPKLDYHIKNHIEWYKLVGNTA